jgi:protein-S-isoprenylcysteine O-methyltransferase Ste14
MSVIQIILFCVLSIVAVTFSRKILFHYNRHGFYRFFAWECIILLIVFNYKNWFQNILSINQIISWFFLLYSLYLIISGLATLKKMGKADESRDDSTLYKLEKTTVLVQTGIYKYIRHPIYGSLVFLTWGIFFKNVTIFLLLISIVATIFLIITAKFDERECLDYFGEKYKDYMSRTRLFVPFII